MGEKITAEPTQEELQAARGAMQWFVEEGILKNQQQADSIKISPKTIKDKEGVAKIELSVDVSKTTEEIKAGILALQSKYHTSRVSIQDNDNTITILATNEDFITAFLGDPLESLKLAQENKPKQTPPTGTITPDKALAQANAAQSIKTPELQQQASAWIKSELKKKKIDLDGRRISAELTNCDHSGRSSIEIKINTQGLNAGQISYISRFVESLNGVDGVAAGRDKNDNFIISGYKGTLLGLINPDKYGPINLNREPQCPVDTQKNSLNPNSPKGKQQSVLASAKTDVTTPDQKRTFRIR
jgi:hypothetical protein